MAKRFKPTLGALVVASHSLDATMFRVVAFEGFNVGVIVAGGPDNQATQWHDCGIFKHPSVGQLREFTDPA